MSLMKMITGRENEVKTYRIVTQYVIRNIYFVKAESADKARDKVESQLLGSDEDFDGDEEILEVIEWREESK